MEQYFSLYRWKDLNRLTIKATGGPSPLLFPSFTFFIIAPSFPATKWFPFLPLSPHFLLSQFLFRLLPLVYTGHKCIKKGARKKAKMPNVCRQRASSSFCVFVMENYFYIILTPGRRLKIRPVWGRLHLLFIVSLWQFEMFRTAVFGVWSCFRLVLLRMEQSGNESWFNSQPICSSKDAGSELKREVH